MKKIIIFVIVLALCAAAYPVNAQSINSDSRQLKPGESWTFQPYGSYTLSVSGPSLNEDNPLVIVSVDDSAVHIDNLEPYPVVVVIYTVLPEKQKIYMPVVTMSQN